MRDSWRDTDERDPTSGQRHAVRPRCQSPSHRHRSRSYACSLRSSSSIRQTKTTASAGESHADACSLASCRHRSYRVPGSVPAKDRYHGGTDRNPASREASCASPKGKRQSRRIVKLVGSPGTRPIERPPMGSALRQRRVRVSCETRTPGMKTCSLRFGSHAPGAAHGH